jgi:hypothetical protein
MKACCTFLILMLNILSHNGHSDKFINETVVAINYNLSKPDKIYVLPTALKEVSGITETDASSIACIQDEKGIIFIYDLVKEQVKEEYPFYNNGDYEGIARVDKTMYILRSDGILFGIANYGSAASVTKSYTIGIPAKDNEGLCFDQQANRLLIAPKINARIDQENKDKRVIYSFDLKSKKLMETPAFVFDIKKIKKFASQNKIKVPMKNGKKGGKKEMDIKFRPSEIGIDPFTNKLFVLSGMERLLFVFNMKGEIEYIEKLDPDLFAQPEGITFMKNGDMLISNDVKNNKPALLRFNYIRK